MATPKEGPVEQPSMANGAQVALEDFSIPQFPREAGGLLALNLISQIQPDQYRNVLSKPFKITHLPPSIQSLTLDGFTLGYPPGFLKALAAEFPELRSLVVYSQQFTGILDESSDDATEFIRGAKKLRALHLLDAHISAAFVKAIAPSIKELEKPLMFIEINYTNRSNVDALLKKIPAAELPLLIHQGLISCSFNIAPPEHKQSERSDLLSIGDGIGVLSKNHSKLLVDKLLDDDSAPKVMKHLNTTLYPISIENLHNILAKHKGLMVLNVSIEVDDATSYRSKLFETLVTASNLEQIELVLCPSDSVTELDIRVDDQAMRALSTACKKLTSLKVNQRRCLRSKSSLECTIDDGKWHIKYNESEQTKVSEQPKSKASRPKQAWSPWT